MFKRLLGLFLAFALVFSCVYAEVIPYNPTKDKDIYSDELFIKLGIVDRDDISSDDAKINKGTALRWAVSLTGMDLASLPKADRQIFSDVSVDSKYADIAAYAFEKGIIKGNDFGEAELLFDISNLDAVTLFIRAVGYSFDAGKEQLAKAQVLNGFDTKATLIAKNAMILLNRVLRLDAVEYINDTFYINENADILSSIFRVTEIRGVVDSDYIININGEVGLKENTVSIDGKVYEADNEYCRSYAGYYVKAYLYKNRSEERIIYMDKSQNDVWVYDVSDIESYKAGALKLKDSKHNVNLDNSSVKTIRNFERILVGNTPLALPQCGKFVLIDNNGDKRIDCVFIYDAEYGIVKNVNAEQSKIYVKGTDESVYDISDYEVSNVFDFDGNDMKLDDISKDWLVEIYASTSKRNIAIVAGNKTVNTSVTTKFKKDGLDAIKDKDGNIYKVSPAFAKLCADKIEPGKTYMFALDTNGLIVYIQSTEAGEMTYGYICAMDIDGVFEQEVKVAIYTENGEKLTPLLRKSIKVTEGGISRSIKAAQFYTEKNSIKSLVRFALNDAGEVTSIEYPTTDNIFAQGFREVGRSTVDETNTGKYDNRMRIKDPLYMLGGQVLMNKTNTKVMIVSDDFSSDDWAIKSVTEAFVNSRYYQNIPGYSINNNSMEAEIVVATLSGLKETYGDIYANAVALVSEFVTEYDDETGEKYTAINGYVDGVLESYRLEDELETMVYYEAGTIWLSCELPNGSEPGYVTDVDLTDVDKPVALTTEPIAEGDVVRLSLNSRGRVGCIKMMYDESEGKVYGKGTANEAGATYDKNRGYNTGERTSFGQAYKIVGNAMYIIPDGDANYNKDIYKVDTGYIYEYDKTTRNKIRVITADEITTKDENPELTDNVFIQINDSAIRIVVVYK